MFTPSHKNAKFPVFPEFGVRSEEREKGKRNKVNFMINSDLVHALSFFIPEGKRSDFVNEIMEDALKTIARKKAMKAMDEIRIKSPMHMTDEEIRNAREYGRE